MRPCVPPSLRRLWRADGVLQIGTEPGRSACVHGLDEAGVRLLSGLDGSRELLRVVRDAGVDGLGASTATALIDRLDACGVLTDGVQDSARRLRASTLAVVGAGPVARSVGDAVAEAGVRVVDGSATGADLVIVCDSGAGPAGPHLFVQVTDSAAVVGPLVVPGSTACRACLHAHRRDRDPGWPLISAQLTWARRPELPDPLLLRAAGALAASEARSYLLGSAPASVEGTLELTAGAWRARRRSWPPHPGCGCVV